MVESYHAISEPRTNVGVTRVLKIYSTWQPRVGATCQTENGRRERDARQPEAQSVEWASIAAAELRAGFHQKSSKKDRFAHHGGELPLRRERESRGRAQRSKTLEVSTSRPIMKEQYKWAARRGGFVRTSLLFPVDLTLR